MKQITCPDCGMPVCQSDVYYQNITQPIRCQYCGIVVIEPSECGDGFDYLDFDELDALTLRLMLDLEDERL